jgi:hypothetical protein
VVRADDRFHGGLGVSPAIASATKRNLVENAAPAATSKHPR